MPDAPTVPIQADFLADIRGEFADQLAATGMAVPVAATADQVLMLYFNSKFRRLAQRSRQVLWSAELRARKLDKDILSGLRRITQASVAGRLLNPFMSTRIDVLDYLDMLWNDWSIAHMHLGPPGTGPNGFVGRRGELLFVYPTCDKLYFLDVLDHKSFEDRQLVEILHRNWPKLIERFLLPGVFGGSPMSGATRRDARKAGLTIATQTDDGTVYGPLGFGYSSARTSMQVRSDADHVLELAYRTREWCDEHAASLRDRVRQVSGTELTELKLSMKLQDAQQWVVVETQTSVQFPIR